MKAASIALGLLTAATPATAADPAKYIRADLIAESVAPRPGSTMLIGIRMTPRPGWHGYWSNPGESGFAPTVRWSAPPGITLGPLQHPAPSLLTVSGASSFVHEGPHVLLARLTLGRGVAPGTPIPVTALLNWAACTATQCVPLRASLTLELTSGSGGKGPDAPLLAAAARRLPRAAPAGSWAISDRQLRLRLPPTLRLDPRATRFFPDDNAMFDAAAGRAAKSGTAVELSAPVKAMANRTISGVASDGRAAYRLELVQGKAPPLAKDASAVTAPITSPAAQSQPGVKSSTSPAPTATPPQPQRRRSSMLWLWVAGAAIIAAAGLLHYRQGRRGRV